MTVIDLLPRECLAIDLGEGPSGRDVVATLERLRFERGLPPRIYCDYGAEFQSHFHWRLDAVNILFPS